MHKLASVALLALALTAAPSATASAQDEAPPPPPREEAPPPPEAEAPTRASLAVVPFTFSTLAMERFGRTQRLVMNEFETTALTNKFVTALVRTRKFDVVERSRVEKLLQEMDLSAGGITGARGIQAGQMVGADFLLMGEISLFTVGASWQKVPYTERWQRTVTAHIILDMRIVDSRASKIVSADTGEVRWENTTMYPSRFDGWETPPELIEILHRQLCEDMVVKTIDGVYPIRIMSGSEGTYTLNRGDGGGLEPGTLLDVFAEGEALVDPDTGEVLGYDEFKLGTIRVTEVLARFSKAVHEAGEYEHPKGAVCRRARGVQPTPAPEPRRVRPPGW